MSVYSMTGYAQAVVPVAEARESVEAGVASGAAKGGAISIDVRSVNSRFLDVAFRLPDEFRALEPALRDVLSSGIRRGKVELRLTVDRSASADSGAGWLQPVPAAQLSELARMEASIQSWMPNAAALSVHEVLQWCRSTKPVVVADEQVLTVARQCIVQLREAREREGARLAEVLQVCVTKLRALTREAAPLLPQVVARQQERFLERWAQALQSAGGASAAPASQQTLAERAMAEAAAFALRIDVAEELSRLGVHLDEIDRLLRVGGEVGKRLDFLIQELHREANTLGSKSAAMDLTRISVDMKVLIEQMREQVQNLE
ncbi:MAG: YicC/YloC family endoribonuclease [Leptothrix ochracea]|uniref:YicC/YloC family endoribonuclease n=1 Tax=Leptothrix ochracea TaxID=735331 RepID=UPI0034E26F8A